ncbi:MAG: alpha/beta hydrolase [Paracoccaceae bacterium]
MLKFTSPDGLQLAYSDEGQGMPVLCLSGLTRDGRDFDYLAPHLPDVRLIRMDYRGRGQSDWADPATYTVPVEATDALALLDHLGVERAAVIGSSRGGLNAMMLASTAIERLRGICLNDIGPEIAESGLEIIMNYIGRNPPFRTREAMVAAMPDIMMGFDNVPVSRWREEVARHTIETPEGLKIPYDPRLRDALTAGEEEPATDLWPLFDAMKGLPLAVIRGANSNLLNHETVTVMGRRRPDMIVAEVPDRGHIPFLDEPEALEAIRTWLEICQ